VDSDPVRSHTADSADVRAPARTGMGALPILGIFLLAAAVRALPWRWVFGGDGVAFSDGDSYYHMWRIWNAAEGSLDLMGRDPFANFPHGGEVLWAPGFDWFLSIVVRTLGLDQPAAEIFSAWVPLALGAAAVALAAHVACRAFGRPAGWVGGLLLASAAA